ncbi:MULTISPECIES: H-NS family histone-like protein [Aeromonas]
MTDFFKTLLNIRSLRVALRDMPLDQVCEAKEKFDLVFAELQEAAEQERAAQEEHNQKLAEFSKLLAEAGIDPIELVDDRQAAWTEGKAKVKTKTKSKREPRPAKYGFMQGGIEATWTGQGRMPKALAEQVKAGKALEDFLL